MTKKKHVSKKNKLPMFDGSYCMVKVRDCDWYHQVQHQPMHMMLSVSNNDVTQPSTAHIIEAGTQIKLSPDRRRCRAFSSVLYSTKQQSLFVIGGQKNGKEFSANVDQLQFASNGEEVVQTWTELPDMHSRRGSASSVLIERQQNEHGHDQPLLLLFVCGGRCRDSDMVNFI